MKRKILAVLSIIYIYIYIYIRLRQFPMLGHYMMPQVLIQNRYKSRHSP